MYLGYWGNISVAKMLGNFSSVDNNNGGNIEQLSLRFVLLRQGKLRGKEG